LSFSAGVHVERIEPRLSFVDDVRSRLVLVYTGRSRVARVVVDRVSSRYRAGEPAVAAALAGLKRTAEAMRAAILAEDLGAMGGLLLENWSYQKELDESVSNRELDGVFELALRNGALGGKACGMGGGGCVVFLSGPADGERLRSALRGRHLTVIDFDFDSYGVFVTKG
jgi:D-glycero-alpha-D-manno-heptose-7-phosphate kinase